MRCDEFAAGKYRLQREAADRINKQARRITFFSMMHLSYHLGSATPAAGQQP